MVNGIKIENFKCFGDERKIEFSHFNILYGKNGRGKSTIIQSLLLLAQNKDSISTLALKGSYVDLGNYKDVVNRYKTANSLKFSISSTIEEELKMSFSSSVNGPTLLALDDLQVGNQRLFSSMGTAEDNTTGPNVSYATSDIKTLELLRGLRYVSANRRGPVNYEERQDEFFIGKDDIGVNGERVINGLLKQNDVFINNFSEALSFILDGATVKVIGEEDSNNIELLLDSRDSSEGFKPTNIGYGYSYVLPIIYQFLKAEKNGIVIAENPEAHLYPAAQSRLIEWMVRIASEKNLQVILETHSDHIINGLRIAIKKKQLDRQDVFILFVDRDKPQDSPEIRHILIDQNGTLSENPSEFMDEWTNQMIDLL